MKSSEPEMLIVADEEFMYGVQNGYYPELKKVYNSPQTKICTYDETHSLDLQLATEPNLTGCTCYMLNRYAQKYMELTDPNLENSLISDQCIAVKELLVALGAKSIRLSREVEDVKEQSAEGELGVGYKVGEVKVGMGRDQVRRMNMKVLIESYDPQRLPKSVAAIENFLRKKGLQHESHLVCLVERLKNDDHQRLYGVEKMSLSFLSEVQDALKLIADINIGLFFNAYAEHETRLKQMHSFRECLEVDFGN